MSGFIIAAVAAMVLVLVLLLRPFLRPFSARTSAPGPSHRELNAAIFREQLARLEQDVAEGTLRKDDYAQARAELQRRAAEDTRQQDTAGTVRAPRKTIAAISVLMPITAVVVYLQIGNPGSMPQRNAPAGLARNEQVMKMVAALEQKLQKDPDNLQGWAMLARSYTVMGRPVDAEQAFARAGPFIGRDAQMLAIYAEVAAINNGGRLAGKPSMLIQKALAADPDNARALWLSGAAQREAGNYAQALQAWERLAAKLPPGSDDARAVQAAVEGVRARTAETGATTAGAR